MGQPFFKIFISLINHTALYHKIGIVTFPGGDGPIRISGGVIFVFSNGELSCINP